jgi:hypothetical protein
MENPWPSEALDRGADVAQMSAGCDRANAAPHRFVRHFDQPLGLNGRRADVEHAAGVTVKTILDHGDVDVDDVAALELLVPGNAMADHVIDRRTQRGLQAMSGGAERAWRG